MLLMIGLISFDERFICCEATDYARASLERPWRRCVAGVLLY